MLSTINKKFLTDGVYNTNVMSLTEYESQNTSA